MGALVVGEADALLQFRRELRDRVAVGAGVIEGLGERLDRGIEREVQIGLGELEFLGVLGDADALRIGDPAFPRTHPFHRRIQPFTV